MGSCCRKGAGNKAMPCSLHFCHHCLPLINWHPGSAFPKPHIPVLWYLTGQLQSLHELMGDSNVRKERRNESWVRKGNKLSHG